MRKEVLIAIGAGTIFGLVIAFGIWRLNSSIENADSQESLPTPSPTPNAGEFGLTIAKPTDLIVLGDNSVTITGATKANTFVIASSEEKDFFVTASDSGAFEAKADLIGGLNQIIIASYDESGQSSQKTVSVVYSSSFDETSQKGNEASESEDPVRQKVEQKVNEVKNSPQAYLGSVTDISEKTLNLKKESGEISQVAVTTDTTYASDLTKKDIQFTDVAIGDFVIAMGYKNGNEVLEAVRILVTKKPSSPSRQIVFGKVKEIKSKVLTLTKTDGSEVNLTFPKTWKGPEIKEIEDQDLAIIVSLEVDRTQIRSIEILK